MPLGRARLQLFRPVSIRLMEAMQIHWGSETELPPDPPTAPTEPKAGTDLELSIRNNWPSIQTYFLQASGDGLEFFPPKPEILAAPTKNPRFPPRFFQKKEIRARRPGTPKAPGAAPRARPM